MILWLSDAYSIFYNIKKITMGDNRLIKVEGKDDLFEVWFNWELDCYVRWYNEAKEYLQRLVDKEDYYNGNEKNYLD